MVIFFQIQESSNDCLNPMVYIRFILYLGGVGCKMTVLGKEYTGLVATTISGKTCQRWDSQSPHRHIQTSVDKFPDGQLSYASNYCRNPNGGPNGPWCYTTDKLTQWEYCNVAPCTYCCFSTESPYSLSLHFSVSYQTTSAKS